MGRKNKAETIGRTICEHTQIGEFQSSLNAGRHYVRSYVPHPTYLIAGCRTASAVRSGPAALVRAFDYLVVAVPSGPAKYRTRYITVIQPFSSIFLFCYKTSILFAGFPYIMQKDHISFFCSMFWDVYETVGSRQSAVGSRVIGQKILSDIFCIKCLHSLFVMVKHEFQYFLLESLLL